MIKTIHVALDDEMTHMMLNDVDTLRFNAEGSYDVGCWGFV